MTETSPPTTIVTPADKPHVGEAVRGALDLMSRAAAGDAEAHKLATFGERYSSGWTTLGADQAGRRPARKTDPRLYSRDPDEIRAFWADRGVRPAAT